MEPLTAGAIALVTLLLNKTFEKTGEIIVTKVFQKGNQIMQLSQNKSPDAVNEIEAAAEKPSFPPTEDFGEAILVEMVELAAKQDPEIKAALLDLADKVEDAQKENDHLKEAVKDLRKAVEERRNQDSSNRNSTKIAETIGKIGTVIQGSPINNLEIKQNL
jgi:polyribonucleotide nucleotidyltransferase